MRNKRLLTLAGSVCLALVLVALSFMVACPAPPEEEEPTPEEYVPEEIHILRMADLAGPYASINADTPGAFADAVDYINGHGACNGVPMRIEDREDLGKLDAAIAYYEEWKAAGEIFYMHWSHSAQIEALKPRHDEDKIVCYTNSPTFISLYPTPGYVFGTCPPYPEQFGLFCDWLVETQPPPWKLAICSWDTEFGRGFWSEEAKDYMEKKGIELVAEEFFPITSLDVSVALTRIYAKGGDGTWVFNNSLAHGPATVIKSADALGLLGKLHFAGGEWNVGDEVRRITGREVFAKSGFVAVRNMHSFDDVDIPGVKLIRDYFYERHGPEEAPTSCWIHCWQVALTMRDAYARAAEAVGWENIDGPALREGFLKLKMEDLDFKISFLSERPAPLYARIYQVDENGEVHAISGWLPTPNLSPETYWTKGPSYLVPEH